MNYCPHEYSHLSISNNLSNIMSNAEQIIIPAIIEQKTIIFRHVDNAQNEAVFFRLFGMSRLAEYSYQGMMKSIGESGYLEHNKGSKYDVEVNSNVDGQAYPSALGKLLPTQIARHFNTMLEYKIVGKLRRIRTVPDLEGRMALKLPMPMPEELDLS